VLFRFGGRALRPRALLALLAMACGSQRGPDVIFLASATDVVERMLGLVGVRAGDVVYDLGCGDGRIVIAAARKHGARGVCVEIDTSLIAASQRNAEAAGVRDRIEFRRADMFETDLGTATVVALYLSPSLNERLRPKILREVRPGTRIVSHNFPMGDWRPDTTVEVEWPSGTTSSVKAWVVPADVAGTWELLVPGEAGERRLRVRFTQRYQDVSGTASADGRALALDAARLRGDSLEFRLTERGGARTVLRFAGQMSGSRMSGTVRSEADSTLGKWRGARP
jgi:SAM-dependent methyltransferase